MAYLLGSQAFIESLKKDVQDLQWTVSDIFSHTGPVHSYSWKFPDKQAADIDIEDLLDLYDSSEEDDAEERQIAHIALYELVIDRLVLMIHSISKFMTSQICSGNVKPPEMAIEKGSVGLLVREFWSQIISMQSWINQAVSEKNSAIARLNHFEKISHKFSESKTFEKSMSQTSDTVEEDLINTEHVTLKESQSATNNLNNSYISKDSNCKACQTYETAFVPCESCDVVQRKMKEAGEIIIKTCTDQGLPSSLKKLKSQLVHVEWLSFNDICRWMAEQNKDIARVRKQNDLLHETINPLKNEVKSCKRRTSEAEEKLKTCEKSMSQEKETQSILRKQMETKIKEQSEKHGQILCEEQSQREALKRAKESLEMEITDIKSQLNTQRKSLKQLEADYRTLQEDLEIKTKEAERSGCLSKEVADLKVQLSEVTAQLEENTKLLTREQGKNRSANKHTESLQSKQANLLTRMETLGLENEELNQQVMSLEEEKAKFDDEIAELTVEAKELRKKIRDNEIVIKNLSDDKDVLEEAVRDTKNSIQGLRESLKEAKERERMIVEYPDLNGPVNTDFQGTGNIALDMSNQVKANCVRIKLLGEQNDGLEESIRKIASMKGHTPSSERSSQPDLPMNPMPLWNQNTSVTPSHFPEHHLPEQEHRPIVAKPQPVRPASGKVYSVTAPVNATSIGAYKQMKRALGGSSAGRDKGIGRKGQPLKERPPSGDRKFVNMPSLTRDTARQDDNVITFSCPRCDKMYMKSRDLEIHLSYCTG